ncbi:hypothetical protein [uncultured Desulfovibrio sp.]|uniref:hypothetical protein n=1 Tax=uncultured Desulfovibrio sp. TaxID=167968 RepID=UPI0026327604|nr:hypothetical protein [uncultured Desulfovibrio sp.]
MLIFPQGFFFECLQKRHGQHVFCRRITIQPQLGKKHDTLPASSSVPAPPPDVRRRKNNRAPRGAACKNFQERKESGKKGLFFQKSLPSPRSERFNFEKGETRGAQAAIRTVPV